METAPEQMTVGLRRKTDDNDIESYRSNNPLDDTMMMVQVREAVLGQVLVEMQNYPEEFLNFGFNFSDFKAFLLKMVFMRAQRRFIQRGLMEKLRYQDTGYNYRQAGEGQQQQAAAEASQP